MSTKSNEKEKILAIIVFASAIFSAAIIVADELSTTIASPLGPLSWLRAPLGLYFGLFPVGYLALAFLFSWKEQGFLERIGLSIAVSISINVVSILLANIFLGFPITLTRNLIIILFWSIVFLLLFLLRSVFLPLATEFWQDYEWNKNENKKFFWLNLSDLVLFVSILAAIIVSISIITKPGQPFNGISLQLQPIAWLFLFLFPTGYFANYVFFSSKEKSILENLLFSIILSLPLQAISAIITTVLSFLGIAFSLNTMIFVSLTITFLFYFYILLDERLLPIINYWLERKERDW
jgi:MFS family permease